MRKAPLQGAFSCHKTGEGEGLNGLARAIDGIIATVAPQAALKRTAARQKMKILTNSGYSNYGANTTKKSIDWVELFWR